MLSRTPPSALNEGIAERGDTRPRLALISSIFQSIRSCVQGRVMIKTSHASIEVGMNKKPPSCFAGAKRRARSVLTIFQVNPIPRGANSWQAVFK